MNDERKIGRREFLKGGATLGGGLIIACHVPLLGSAWGAAEEVFAPNAFLRIDSDAVVTIIVNKSEMGQGVYTSLPMLVAEELECDWQKVRIEAAPVAPIYNHTAFGPLQVTGGSSSIWSEWERLSGAGAAARQMLIAAAAQRWQTNPASCSAKDGVVLGPGEK